jgi:competence protein ComEA
MTLRRTVAIGMAVVMAALMAATPAVAATEPAPADKIDLNSATVEQLDSLPGVGPTLAGRIVEYREEAGRFGTIEELLNVKGIGEKNFQKIEPLLKVTRPSGKGSK